MIDNTVQKMPTRFVVVREFAGAQSMEDAFGALVERQAGESYERWKNDHSGGQGSPPAGADIAYTPDIEKTDDGSHGMMDIMTPVSARADQTA